MDLNELAKERDLIESFLQGKPHIREWRLLNQKRPNGNPDVLVWAITTLCPICSVSTVANYRHYELLSWVNGEFIQNAFLSLGADQRELLLTGMDECHYYN